MRTSVDEGAGEDPPELVLPRHAAGVEGPDAQQVFLRFNTRNLIKKS